MSMATLESIYEKVSSGGVPDDQEIAFLINYPEERVGYLLVMANKIKERFFGRYVSLCSIVNAKSGGCSEDCIFCAQSSFYRTGIKRHGFLSQKTIGRLASYVSGKGVARFSMVTSGKGPTKKDLSFICRVVESLKQSNLDVDVSLGELSREDVVCLKDSGVTGIHTNLETSAHYFPRICTTHSYRSRIRTVEMAKEEGLYVCSGGLFGIGESWRDRVDLALTLRGLSVDSVPINFLMPIRGTPLQDMPVLSVSEALKIIALFRFLLPDKEIRVCGGRSAVFCLEDKYLVLKSGASGIMVGNYLTRKGFPVDSDLEDIKSLGMDIRPPTSH